MRDRNGQERVDGNSRTIYDVLGRNPVHPFPARMAPSLALDVVSEFKEPQRVLDPMSGSGTVLAVAHHLGHQAIGVDIDPLAVLISKVWTTSVNPKEIRDSAAEVLNRARRTSESLCASAAYPRDSDEETRRFVRFWFDPSSRRQLAALSSAIDEVHDDTIRYALWCAFSRLIITKKSGASLAMDLSHSRPHRVFKHAPAKPFGRFLSAAAHVAANCGSDSGSKVDVREGDARSLEVEDSSIDLVITSPPYLNAIDYIRCSKFSLVWMGYQISEMRRLRSTTVGVEKGSVDHDPESQRILAILNLQPGFPSRYESILARYIDDMRLVVSENARVLRDNGKAVYVIGDNTIRGTVVRSSLIIESVAEIAGLRLMDKRSRELPANRRYLPPPTAQSDAQSLAKRMRREVVLTFERVKQRDGGDPIALGREGD